MTIGRGIGKIGGLLAVAALLSASMSRAQKRSAESEGIESGNYSIRQSAEIGYRSTAINGDQGNYSTFVNLDPGVRLFDYTLNMRSRNHVGWAFDTLDFSNSGYGGDPNNVSRLRIEKNKYFDFQALMRRDQNYWNYNLFLNPFNPTVIAPTNPATNPVIAVTNSPHALHRLKRLQDYNLMLFPESRMRLRLGYSHNVDNGPAMSTFNGPADRYALNENYKVTMNGYRVGFDFRFLPRTTISYDQVLEYDKEDTSDSLAYQDVLPMAPGTVSGPVDFGIEWFYPPQGGTRPCTPVILPSGYANPNCRAFLGYSRYNNPRNFMPTERLSFQSKIIKNLEMSGSGSYSTSRNIVNTLNENVNEWTASAAVKTRGVLYSGPAESNMVAVHANWSGIYSLTPKLAIIDLVRFDNWRNPGLSDLRTGTVFAAQATGLVGIQLPQAQFSAVVPGAADFASICPGPAYNASTCPQHTAAAAPDLSRTAISTFLGQRTISNTLQLQADITPRIRAQIGYLYEDRVITENDYFGGSVDYYEQTNHVPPYLSATYYPGGAGGTAANYFFAARGLCAIPSGTNTLPTGCTLNPGGTISYVNPSPAPERLINMPIHANALIAGVGLRPRDSLRINADFQLGYNDRAFTQISPRQFQSYKIHETYRPNHWASIDGAIDINENRNNVINIDALQHARTYSLGTVLTPNGNFSLSLGYSYTDLFMQSYICVRDTGYNVPPLAPCAFYGGTSAITLGAMSHYSNTQHFLYGDITFKPAKRITTSFGYAGTSAGGDTLYLNPRIPGGTLAFVYLKPSATITFDLSKRVSYRMGWNYYGYSDRSGTAITGLQPIGSEDFNGNNATFALRYAF